MIRAFSRFCATQDPAFEDLQAERSYRGYRRYGETKLAIILFTSELSRHLAGSGLTANCFHPGLVATGFNRNNGLLMALAMTVVNPMSRAPDKGAETLVWLATSPQVEGVSGSYFFDMKAKTDKPGGTRQRDCSQTLGGQ